MILKQFYKELKCKTFITFNNDDLFSNRCPACKNVIHIADNKATPRDLVLLNQMKKPVKVLTCQVDVSGVNPKLLDIADKTGGSLHTLDQDIVNLSGITVGGRITIGQREYRRTSSGFVVV